jgi:hypothetical protein
LWVEQPSEDLWFALIESIADDMANNQMDGGAERIYRHLRNHVNDPTLRLLGQLRELQISVENVDVYENDDEDEDEDEDEASYQERRRAVVAEMVRPWAVSAGGERWIFHKAVLLEDFDTAFSLLPSLLANCDIDGRELSRREYSNLRRDNRFKVFDGPALRNTESRQRWA